MRKLLFTTLLVAISLSATAQSQDIIDAKADSSNQSSLPYLQPEFQPQFPGGKDALIKFLSENIKYPKLAQKYGVGGKVMMNFIIDTKGKPTEITAKDCKIEHFSSPRFSQEPRIVQKELEEKFALEFAKEAARVIRKMPNWTPGTLDGKPVRVKYTLPITFKLP